MSSSERISLEETLQEISKFHFILSEGRKGNHLLFNPEIIRITFTRDEGDLFDLFEQKLDKINDVLNHSFSLKSFEEKRAYLSSLPTDLQCALVFGYFQLLDGQLIEEDEEPITVH